MRFMFRLFSIFVFNFTLIFAGVSASGVELAAVDAQWNSERVQVVQNPQFASGSGIALREDAATHTGEEVFQSEPDIIFHTKIESPGIYHFETTAAVTGATKEKLQTTRTKMDSVPVRISVGDGLIGTRYVVEPWQNLENCTARGWRLRLAPTVDENGTKNEDVTIRVWIPKDLIFEKIKVKPYTPPKVPEEAAAYEPPIVPPSNTHPRILATSEYLPTLRANLSVGENAEIWNFVQKEAEKPFVLNLPEGRCVEHDSRLLGVVQMKAFVYLMTQNEARGREAVEILVPYMQRIEFGNLLDITREIGTTIYTAALVYDWCFPLLDAQEKTILETNMMRLADDMECGWPPFRQSIVNGHGAEGQIMQHLLTMSVALYDVNPEPYKMCSRLILEQLVPQRACEYESPRHNQGVNYGSYRIQYEYYAGLLLERMSGKRVFNENICRMPLYFLNMRLPDGYAIPDGDCYLRGTYSNPSLLMMMAYCRDPEILPLLKAEYARQLAQKPGKADSVLFLLVNDPTVAPDFTYEKLPLAFDSGTRLASLILRTKWMNEDFMREKGAFEPDSDAVIVELKGGGYNSLNHQHADAGAFQIYSHGWISRDLGVYGFYGLPYDMKFNKASASHNVLLIRNPDGTGDGGQRRPAANPKSAQQIQEDPDVQTGTVLETTMEPSAEAPVFVRYSVDLTPAYSDRAESYVRTFLWRKFAAEESSEGSAAAGIPVVLVVSDQVRLKSPESRCFWQFNTFCEPTVTNEGLEVSGIPAFNATHSASKAALTVLLPPAEERVLDLVGGERANSVFEAQYSTPVDAPETHGWRAMYTTKNTNQEVHFLNVIQVLNDGAAPLPVEWDRKNPSPTNVELVSGKLILR